MAMIEVKANLSFGTWRQGKHYAVDEDDPKTQALIVSGYLTRLDVRDKGVDVETPAVPLKPKKFPSQRRRKAADGEDRVEPARGDADSAAQSDPDGDQTVPADVAGS